MESTLAWHAFLILFAWVPFAALGWLADRLAEKPVHSRRTREDYVWSWDAVAPAH